MEKDNKTVSDLIQVFSGNKDLKVGINNTDLALLIGGFFVAVLFANIIANKI